MNKSQKNTFFFFRSAFSISIVVLGLSSIAGPSWAEEPSQIPGSCKNNWLAQGQIGLSTSYFPMKIENHEVVVNKFQAQTVANQAADAGVSWFLLTLHHESWFMMAPNATYDRIMGNSDYTPDRDVPLELAQQLQAKGIKLMLYVNLKLGPNTDPKISSAMGGWPPNDKLIENIAAVYREYSLRYGDKVAGWWVDGVQNPSYKSSSKREQWFKTIADALRAGNPNALVTFNPGLVELPPGSRVVRYSGNADYTAGESEDIKPLPNGRWFNGAQWHLWTFLGGWWGSGGMRYSDQELGDYVSQVTAQGGALTFEVGTLGVNREGKAMPGRPVNSVTTPYFGYIDPNQIKQIKSIEKYRHTPTTELLLSCTN